MRDPKRINDFCNRLKAVWSRMPDCRFGQFMVNALDDMKANGKDPFFLEDDEMIKYIERYFNRKAANPDD